MRIAREWDEEYIYSLSVQEYDHIEFKSSQLFNMDTPSDKDKIRNDLAKEICALANSGGGMLVIGIRDPKKCLNGVLEIDDGGVLKSFGRIDTAEWLRANIPNLIERE